MSRPRFTDVRMSRCELTRCLMWEPSFERCDFVDLKFTPPKRINAEYLADGYRRLRAAFQSQGDRREASRFYFEERFQMMRALAFPIFPRGAKGLPSLAWADTFSTMYDHWLTRRISRRKIVTLLGRNVRIMLKILLYPPYLFRFLWLKAKDPAGAGGLSSLGLWREADSDLLVDGCRHRRVHGVGTTSAPTQRCKTIWPKRSHAL